MDNNDHLKATVSERGLVYLPAVESSHRINGHRERARAEVHTSSAVEPSIWVRVTDEIGLADDGGRAGPFYSGDVVQLALHLPNEEAVKLAEQILALTKGEPAIEYGEA